jgi:Ca2+-binding RTX toxin-like protein
MSGSSVGSGNRRGKWIAFGVAVASVAALAVPPTAAHADECSINKVDDTNPGNALFDSGGYEWDVVAASDPSRMRRFAALDDGGSNGPAGTPPGPRAKGDSYDSWGGLYVGTTTDDAPLSTVYQSPDDNSCTREDGGRELVFPKLSIGGLQVQRKLFVAASGFQGARILVLLTNPGAGPVTTTVQLGGTVSPLDGEGSLGSSGNTRVRSSSSGDATFTPGDLWGVTSDHDAGGGTMNADLALAHVVDGQGGVDRIDRVLAGVPTGASGEFDQLTLRWEGVTILPGQTAAFIIFEVQQGVAGANAAAEDAAAAAQAQAIENAVPKAKTRAATSATSALYSGMSAREIGSLRNWPSGLTCFGRAPTIVGDDPANDILRGTSAADVIYSFGGRDRVNGKGGKDRICGIGGNDKLKGGPGKDKLDGGPGKDKLLGGKGKDTCAGAGGKDKAGGCEKLKKIP